MVLNALQEIGHLSIRIMIMGIVNLGALPKQRVGFVKEEDRPVSVGHVEDTIQILLGFTDVFADDRRQVHTGQVQLQLRGQHFGGLLSTKRGGPGQHDDCPGGLGGTGLFRSTRRRDLPLLHRSFRSPPTNCCTCHACLPHPVLR